jgi:beta-mannosidase
LLKAGKIPDPFYRDEGKQSKWVGEVPWTYTRGFDVSPAFLSRRHIVLRCEGLDTAAEIAVNGRPAGHADNMFRTWEYDVRPLLKVGKNVISVTFQPPAQYLAEVAKRKPQKVNDWGYLRKAPFQQGWDFAPVLETMGIWKGIGLVGWSEGRLTDLRIDQDHSRPGHVGLTVSVQEKGAADLLAHVQVFFGGHPVAQTKFAALNGSARLDLKNPHLWWPNGMGDQSFYDVRVSLLNHQGQVVDNDARRIGLRTITWIPKTDHSPLTLAVNGRRFFAKGSNWVPRDAMIGRATPAEERRMVEEAVSAHIDLLRLWGGGTYESDAFFNACDEKGLLVWCEFKFADAAYPSFDPEWLGNVRAEASDFVRRVRSHPSVAVWSGNNEVIGFIADKRDPGHMSREDYNQLFHEALPDVVHGLTSGANYTPGSPEAGDDHDWSVWHGSSGFESYRDVHGFLSEFGFQAFPAPESIQQFTSAADRKSVLSPVMEFHQRNWRDGNQLILNVLRRYYRKPKDFESTLWLSQIQQADGILTGVEHWRRDWPNSTGSLVWQYDDCWPSVSWAMVDYYGRPKALFYRLRHAYAPVMLSGVGDGTTGSTNLWVANDRRRALRGTLEWRLLDTRGITLKSGRTQVSIAAGTSSTLVLSQNDKPQLDRFGVGNVLFWARLRVPGEPDSTAVLNYARPKDLNLQDPHLKGLVERARDGFRVTLSATAPALWSWIDLPGIDARLADNFVHVRPGEPVSISVAPHHRYTLRQISNALKVRSLFDTYRAGDDYRAPVVSQASDGSVTATAEDAEILGDTAILEAGTPGNIGNWSDPADRLQWTIKDLQPGDYAVTIDLSSPPHGGGSRFEVSIGDQTTEGVVPETENWTSYRDVQIGALHVGKGGAAKLILTPQSKMTTHVMNLRRIVLTKLKPQ